MASDRRGLPADGAAYSVAPGGYIDHVAVNVPDLRAAVSFFVSAFGARVVFEVARIDGAAAMTRLGADERSELALAMLEIGKARVELIEWSQRRADATNRAWPSPDSIGVTHVAIGVDDLPAALRKLRRLDGVTVIGEPITFSQGPTPGLANAFVRAPWGLLVELVCWTSGRV